MSHDWTKPTPEMSAARYRVSKVPFDEMTPEVAAEFILNAKTSRWYKLAQDWSEHPPTEGNIPWIVACNFIIELVGRRLHKRT